MDADFITFQRLVVFLSFIVAAKIATPCEIETGESIIILDIKESVGNQSSQSTQPDILPIRGDLHEIQLKIIRDSENVFQLRGKQLKLKRPLNRDAKDISVIQLQIRCTNISSNVQSTLSVRVRVIDVNDNAPHFLNLPYVTTLSKLTAVGSSVFSGLHTADNDSSVNSLVEYYVVPGNGSKSDGYGTFAIDFPLNGDVILKKSIAYERVTQYESTIIAIDRATKPYQRLTSTATLTIYVSDVDRASSTAATYVSCVTLRNRSCTATQYSIDADHGKVVNEFDRNNISSTIDRSDININKNGIKLSKSLDVEDVKNASKDETPSGSNRVATAKSNDVITKSANYSPLILRATSTAGFVDENSPVGTIVVTRNKQPLQFSIVKQEVVAEIDRAAYELHLSTSAFSVTGDWLLTVADGDLDADVAQHFNGITFQATVKRIDVQLESSPLTLTIYVNNVNDNVPHIEPIEPISIAPSHQRVYVTRVRSRDVDVDDQITYSLYNDGNGQFIINSTTGVIEAIGPLYDEQTYKLTVAATDRGGKSSSRDVEVYVLSPTGRVVPTEPSRHIFDIQVSEAVSTGSAILSLQPGPRPNDDVTYAIMEGNDGGQFALHPSTGVLTVRLQLDREKIGHYTLGLRAIDRYGLTTNTIVNVEVTDVNDCNPEFIGQPYVFYANENLINAVIGKVKAVDADAWINGVVHYEAPSNAPIAVDDVTGEIKIVRAFDYERQTTEYVIVSAKDGADQPRIATATVTVMVNDVPDEMPVFRKKIYDGAVPENMANVDIVQVTADDADLYKQITYVIRSGPLNKFAVDPSSGVVRTVWPLDYEETSSYVLVIGTRENPYNNPDSTCVLRIAVLDRNDIPPQFSSIPSVLKLKDVMQSGTIVAKVTAADGDGTPPNNVIKYYLSKSNGAKNYFDIDHDSGIISLKGDLKQEASTRLQLEVKVSDMGNPPMTSSINIPITIDHSQSIHPPIAFAETAYKVEIDENSLGNTVVKTMSIVNKPLSRAAIDSIKCEIKSGNELDHFYVKISDTTDCELRTKGQKLDFETRQNYQISVALKSTNVLIDPQRSSAMVVVNVRDLNDNRPTFVYQWPQHQMIGQRFVTALSRDAATLTPFAKLTATDSDSGVFGDVIYRAIDDGQENAFASYFVIDADTGLVRNSRTFEGLSVNVTTLTFAVMARDNPRDKEFLNSTTNLTINLISDEHRLVLVIMDANTEKVSEQKDKLTRMLQDNTNYVVNIEKIETRKFINNSKIITDAGGTDVWLNAIDPQTLAIVRVDDRQLHTFLLDDNQQKTLLYSMSSVLEMKVSAIRTPILAHSQIGTVQPALRRTDHEMDGFQAALIALAGIIAILGFIGIIYLCVIWARYVSYRDRLMRLSLAPKYDPVLYKPNLKPYETQVLRMNMQNDDSSSIEDSYMPFDLNGPIDDLSFMTKETGDISTLEVGQSSSTESDSLEIGDVALFSRSIRSRSGRNERVTFADVMRPAQNPVYHSSDENTGSPTDEFTPFPLRRPTSMVTTEL